MVGNTQDLTAKFNASANGTIAFDCGEWDYVNVQIVTPSAQISFLSSNDSGAVTGVTDGNATSAINFAYVQGTNLLTGNGEANTSAANTIHQFKVVGRYIQLMAAAGTTIGKLLVTYQKIQ